MSTSFAAVVPVFQGEKTLLTILHALRDQAPAPGEIVVVDDGSTDGTAAVATKAGVRIVKLGANLGRGAARDRAMRETDSPLVLMCDVTMQPALDFTARALPWFSDERVAAVFGRVNQSPPKTAADRWRGRHLFKVSSASVPVHGSLFATSVCMVRRSAVEAVGGFDPRLRAGEDAELGRRLLAAGWDVVSDPALHACSLTSDSAGAVLRRYARWNTPDGVTGRRWLSHLAYAVKVMARDDLRARDPLAVFLSLAVPFYQWRRR